MRLGLAGVRHDAALREQESRPRAAAAPPSRPGAGTREALPGGARQHLVRKSCSRTSEATPHGPPGPASTRARDVEEPLAGARFSSARARTPLEERDVRGVLVAASPDDPGHAVRGRARAERRSARCPRLAGRAAPDGRGRAPMPPTPTTTTSNRSARTPLAPQRTNARDRRARRRRSSAPPNQRSLRRAVTPRGRSFRSTPIPRLDLDPSPAARLTFGSRKTPAPAGVPVGSGRPARAGRARRRRSARRRRRRGGSCGSPAAPRR